MDGTLVDSEKLWDVALHELAAQLRRRALRRGPAGDGRHQHGRRRCGIAARRPRPAASATRATASAWLDDADARAVPSAALRVAARRAGAAARRSGRPASRPRWSPPPAGSWSRWRWTRSGRDSFDVVVCGDEVTATKPDPEPYLTAAAAARGADRRGAWRSRTRRPGWPARWRPARRCSPCPARCRSARADGVTWCEPGRRRPRPAAPTLPRRAATR